MPKAKWLILVVLALLVVRSAPLFADERVTPAASKPTEKISSADPARVRREIRREFHLVSVCNLVGGCVSATSAYHLVAPYMPNEGVALMVSVFSGLMGSIASTVLSEEWFARNRYHTEHVFEAAPFLRDVAELQKKSKRSSPLETEKQLQQLLAIRGKLLRSASDFVDFLPRDEERFRLEAHDELDRALLKIAQLESKLRARLEEKSPSIVAFPESSPESIAPISCPDALLEVASTNS